MVNQIVGFFKVQHLKKKVMDQVDFMHVDKHRNLLQGDTILFSRRDQTCQSTQNNNFAKSLQYLKKELRDEIDFLCR